MKLNHFVARSGICSRRNAAILISTGEISVNGSSITDPSYTVKQTDVVAYRNKVIAPQTFVYILVNKPIGYVSTTADEQGRRTVFDLLPKNIRARLFTVGRLDQETTGLILLTNDGALAQKLAHPRYQVSKGYKVTVDKPLQMEDLQILKKGIRLRDGRAKIDSFSIQKKNKQIITVFIHSGKKHIIRRLFAHVGYFVRKLERVSFAGLTSRGLKVGAWRRLTSAEIEKLQKLS